MTGPAGNTQGAGRELRGGWRWARLGDLATFINGRAFKPEEWSEKGLPIIRIENLNSPSAAFNRYGGPYDPRHAVADGDLLISWSASLDAYLWERGPALLNQHIFRVTDYRGVTREYLYYAARAAMVRIRNQVHGATMRHITKPEFKRIEVPLAPPVEQARVVAALKVQLAAVERARAAAEARVAAASTLPVAYLRAAFANGSMDGWPVAVLEEVAELRPSRSIASDGEVEVVATTTACLSEAGFVISGVKAARMSAEDAAISMLAPGEVLVARSNTPELVGRAALFTGAPSDVVASDLTIRVWPRDRLDASFLAAFLSYLFVAGYWKERAGGASGSMKKITRTQLLAQRVPTPPLREQRQIAHRLGEQMASAVRARASVEAELEAIDALPASLLRQAFSGHT